MTSSAHSTLPRARMPAAFWLAAVALTAVAAALALEIGWPTSAAQGQTGAASGDKLLLVAGQVASDSYGLYLVDAEKSTISVYQWLPASRKLRLMASRNYAYDLQLEEYNTEPSPREIRKLVEQARAGGAESRPSD